MKIITVWLLIAVSPNNFIHGTPVTLAQLASESACEKSRSVLIEKNRGGVWHCVPADVVIINGDTQP